MHTRVPQYSNALRTKVCIIYDYNLEVKLNITVKVSIYRVATVVVS